MRSLFKVYYQYRKQNIIWIINPWLIESFKIRYNYPILIHFLSKNLRKRSRKIKRRYLEVHIKVQFLVS